MAFSLAETAAGVAHLVSFIIIAVTYLDVGSEQIFFAIG